jgi:hypothetical protein
VGTRRPIMSKVDGQDLDNNNNNNNNNTQATKFQIGKIF